ncbi:helix-turn-helix transcriptional regulator [Anaerotignum propionicum]|uniref:HTH domain protein n=2 Tax=root TaxID=1 RepID=A0A0X1U7D9_ANAPI|nr:YafY family protein [Anaerotignum propionicum]AMJ40860.1 HTH domain protein [Anaerotignum propionicum DSM 1682]MEA5056012.1 YafY family protein [Anaerotignum propionicum]SHE75127.1 Predicted DNA-binding transcriptional regulator YafY, contains an HTH and WYL domains [[Clostridium] propionicum DSM 1682] [Anaerotignum propionicum DSM 1682]
MKIDRLLEMVYVLFEKKNVTAKELSNYFEVSQRTIYRDLETLSAAGIPIYTSKGKGGGIRLLDSYVMKKSMVTDKDQLEIISSLQGMNALNVPGVEPVLKKLGVLFQRNESKWIDVDFSHWGSGEDEKEKFMKLKSAIIYKKRIQFDYYSTNGEYSERIMEPLQLIFKGQAWYVYGFCMVRNAYRMFRVTRINKLNVTDESFERCLEEENRFFVAEIKEPITMVLQIDPFMAFRVYDEFEHSEIVKNDDGSFTVTKTLPENDWVYGYILSFGASAQVLEPKNLRDSIRKILENSLKKYI